MSKLTIEFPTDEDRDNFLSWFSDGGGESYYMDSLEDGSTMCHVNNIDYSRAFSAWGYDPKKHGDPVIDARIIDFFTSSILIPAKKEITDLVPGRNLLAIIT